MVEYGVKDFLSQHGAAFVRDVKGHGEEETRPGPNFDQLEDTSTFNERGRAYGLVEVGTRK